MNRDRLIAQLEHYIAEAKPLLAIGADETQHLHIRQQAQRKASALIDRAIVVARQLKPFVAEKTLWN